METEPNRTASAVSLSAQTSIAGAARLMTVLNLRSVLVRENEAVAGMLSYQDVTRALRRARGDVSVAALMTRDPIDPGADTKLAESAVAVQEPRGIEDRAPTLFAPDTLLPSQYFDRVRRSAEYDPERRLMVAVLEQGVNDYVKHVAARDPKQLELWRDAEEWVEDRDARWLFSFENICNVLDIEPDYVRRGLHAWKERARRGGREETAATAGETTLERARAKSA
jgi:hypothetical protein